MKQDISGGVGKNSEWKIIGHSHQIADTGDYDGCYEITNGKMSFYTKDGDSEDEDSLPIVVKALNECDCYFYLDDSETWLISLLEQQVMDLEKELNKLRESQPTPIDSKEGAEEEEDDIYDSIYMKVVEIVEKDNIQGEMYNETANKLKEMFDIKYAPPKQ